MIRLDAAGNADALSAPLAYVRDASGVRGRLLKITRWLRAVNAERYMKTPGGRHLDIGCGDGYFLKRSPCAERFGLDMIYGDVVADRLAFPDAHFDYVTMLAVLDMFDDPRPLLADIARVLKPEGRLIITTPSSQADGLLRFYLGPSKEKQTYIDAARMREISSPRLSILGGHTFLLGLNQVFCLGRG